MTAGTAIQVSLVTWADRKGAAERPTTVLHAHTVDASEVRKMATVLSLGPTDFARFSLASLISDGERPRRTSIGIDGL